MTTLTDWDILCLSTQDWDALPTRKHRFMRWFAEGGNRVLYIEQQMHWAGWLADLRNQWSRAFKWLRGPRQVASNLWVYTLPPVIPFFQMFRWINRLNNWLLQPVLRAQLKQLGFEKRILWTYTPHSGDFVGKLGESLAVYECVDEFSAARGLVWAETIRALERELIERCNLVIVTAQTLYDSKKSEAQRIVLIHNGAEVNHFNKVADASTPVASALADLPHPVVGFLGAIQYWVDVPLLARIAREHPEWSMALVGPPGMLVDLSELERLPNVRLLGRVPYADLPGYLRAFDVCLNPYKMDGVAEGCSPIKLYEYLATGKPIVSVDMPEARRFDDLIYVAHNADEFVECVEAAVADTDGAKSAQRLAEAELHTWRGRFETAQDALLNTLTVEGLA
jgi:glycosyltransferase involved in cell wall biosynthesis